MRRVVASACQGCLSNCPVKVEVEDGRAVRVRGNDASAATGGAACPALAITLEQEYDPDRVLTPLRRRNGEKGRGVDPCFEPVSWDEALDEIADRLMALRAAGHPERFALAKGRSTGINDVLMRAFPEIYGTPNRFNHDSICADAEKLATGALDGRYDYHDYDWEHLECAILWGADPVASNRQKAHARRALPAALDRGASVFVVDPRRSATAELVEKAARRHGGKGGSAVGCAVPCGSSADAPADAGCWVPVVPGTDGALASAIARVVLAEGLWNRDYVGDFKDGANRFAEAARDGGAVDGASFRERFTRGVCAWWNEELRDKTPEWASAQTGIAVSAIVRMARTFAKAGQRAVSWVSPGVTMTARGLYSGMACYALNGLVGSIDAEGGVLSFPSLPVGKLPSTETYRDDLARRACAKPRVDVPDSAGFLCAKGGRAQSAPVTNLIPQAIVDGRIDALIAYWCNFPFSCMGAKRWERALEKLPFLVHVTTHISEMSHYADIVLPARHHLFETWGFARCRQNGRSSVVLEQPCVPALGDSRNDEAGVAYALAEKLADRGFPNILDYYRRECADPCTGAVPKSGDELAEYAVKATTAPLWRRADSNAPARSGALSAVASGVGAANDAIAGESGAKAPDTANLGVADPVGTDASSLLEDAWQAFRAKGLWETDPVRGRREGEAPASLPTPSGCFEFESGALCRAFEDHARRFGIAIDDVAASLGYEARGRKSLVPHFELPRRAGDTAAYPFVFSQHRSIVNLEGRSANAPLYQKLKRLDPGDEPWDDVVKIHPDDMRALDLASGDEVRIASEEGAIVVHAKAWDGTRPGVVVKCYGQGHWAYGHVAAADFDRGVPRGGNNNEILPVEWERASGATARHGGLARVRIERA